MTEDQFIELYEQHYGERPSQSVISEYMERNNSEYTRESSSYPRYSTGSQDLFFELKDLTSSIAEIAYKNKEALENGSEKISQFSYMFWIFLAKSMLYFLFQSSQDQGYDFRHM